MIDDPLIYVRAVHFIATITVAGVAFFIIFIAEPAFQHADNGTPIDAFVRPVFAWIGWIGLLVTAVSGAAWLVLLAQSMSDSPLAEVFSEGILWTVLLQTGFGRDWLARFVLAGLLAGIFVPFLSPQRSKSVWIKLVVVSLAASLVGTLARATRLAAPVSGQLSIRLPISCIWSPRRPGSERSFRWRWSLLPQDTTPCRSPWRER